MTGPVAILTSHGWDVDAVAEKPAGDVPWIGVEDGDKIEIVSQAT